MARLAITLSCSCCLAAKRSYYRRQNRQTNIKQAIDQIQGELKTARSKVAVFRQLLREAGHKVNVRTISAEDQREVSLPSAAS